jgi:hypothetical protein
VGVADNITGRRGFSTNFTFIRHDIFSLQDFAHEIGGYSYLSRKKNASPFRLGAEIRRLFLAAAFNLPLDSSTD